MEEGIGENINDLSCPTYHQDDIDDDDCAGLQWTDAIQEIDIIDEEEQERQIANENIQLEQNIE